MRTSVDSLTRCCEALSWGGHLGTYMSRRVPLLPHSPVLTYLTMLLSLVYHKCGRPSGCDKVAYCQSLFLGQS